MLKANRTKRTLAKGDPVFGTMLRFFLDPQLVPLCASAGWDFVVADSEHCAFDARVLANWGLLAACESMNFMVRTPDKLYHQLAQPLDFGAEGLVVPRVETAEQAWAVVRSTRYHPLGERGASQTSIAARLDGQEMRSYIEWANRETLIIIQIETVQGLENIDEILAVSGIDGVLIGPQDLSLSMGMPGETRSKAVQDACRRIVEACAKHNLTSGIHVMTVDAIRGWYEAGMRFFLYQYDYRLFRDACSKIISELRTIPEGESNP